MDPWPLSEKVQKSLQIIVNYTPNTSFQKVLVDPYGSYKRNHHETQLMKRLWNLAAIRVVNQPPGFASLLVIHVFCSVYFSAIHRM